MVLKNAFVGIFLCCLVIINQEQQKSVYFTVNFELRIYLLRVHLKIFKHQPFFGVVNNLLCGNKCSAIIGFPNFTQEVV